jgi:hypothetical protein
MYPEDDEIKNIPLYSKYNRARDGDLQQGDQLIDVQLCSPDNENEKISLSSFYRQECEKRKISEGSPFVILAGSIT